MAATIINFAEYRARRLVRAHALNPNHDHMGFDAGEPNAFMRQWLVADRDRVSLAKLDMALKLCEEFYASRDESQ